MIYRDTNRKILDIKAIRQITYFLGKIGIKCCIRIIPQYNPFTLIPQPEFTIQYGLGLKETKDLVERMWDYQPVKNSPLDQLQKGNMLHEIKRTRQLMAMLQNLGLKTPETGLYYAKGFVTRMRSR